jgi:hypothetical protein
VTWFITSTISAAKPNTPHDDILAALEFAALASGMQHSVDISAT